MLEIRRVKRYTIAKYPHDQFVASTPPLLKSAAARGAVSAALLALLEACEGVGGTGTTGPPPVVPQLMTENEGRRIIEQTFSAYGVEFENDVRFVLRRGPNDSTVLNLDGFNDSLSVGYEYIYETDANAFNAPIRNTLDSLISESGPYIKTMESTYRTDYGASLLEQIVEEFVDTLKANGVI